MQTYHVLIFMKGIGRQVKKTVINKKNFLPHTSDRAPIKGALKNDSKPWNNTKMLENAIKTGPRRNF